ncbi:hypothetical protein [Ferroplasma sp. Type II]|uniref:hypothetical protein n=1 Tax=Ferroplasma sp. Type II TaxID=261388 RepID=UPI0025B9C489|nr:hypothetical protein [Ferroplasma sp. Type II]
MNVLVRITVVHQYTSMRLRINTVQRGKSVLKYAQIIESYVDSEKKTTRMVKHLGLV